MADSILQLQGPSARLELYDDHLTITATGAIGKMSQKGSRTIYLKDITSVQYKPGSLVSGGYLHFTVPGGRQMLAGVQGAAANDNAIVFVKKENGTAEQVKAQIEAFISKQFTASGATSALSPADEILKYKSLMDQGVITAEEFNKKKQELLGL